MSELRGRFLVREEADELSSLLPRLLRLLRGLEFKPHRAATQDDGFVIVGSRGDVKKALAGRFIPFNALLGFCTRVRVKIQVRRSLNADDDRMFLYLRIWPGDELYDTREQWQATQSWAERIGDTFQTRRVFGKIVNALSREEIIYASSMRRDRPTTEASRRLGPWSCRVSLICFLVGLIGIFVCIFPRFAWISALIGAVGLGAGIVALSVCEERRTRQQAAIGAWGNGAMLILHGIVVMAMMIDSNV